ncbi:hypothetical protein ACRAWF_33860 [Streptomyces sp. L7]
MTVVHDAGHRSNTAPPGTAHAANWHADAGTRATASPELNSSPAARNSPPRLRPTTSTGRSAANSRLQAI